MKGYFVAFALVLVFTLGIGLTEAQAAPDFIIAEDSLMVQNLTAAGVKIFITDTTQNIGTAANATMTSYYLSTDTTLGNSIALLASRYVPELKHNESNTGGYYVRIPNAVPAGNYYIIAKADDNIDSTNPLNTGYRSESDEENNTSTKPIQIVSTVSTKLPDLVVTVLTPPATAKPGDLIYVTNRTKNNGPGAAVPSVTSLYLSSSCTIGASAVLLRTRDVPALPAGAYNQRNTPVKIPLTTAPGAYKIIAEADAFNINNEGANEGNNTKCVDITIE